MYIENAQLTMSAQHRLEESQSVSTRLVKGVLDKDGNIAGPASVQRSEVSFKNVLEEEMALKTAFSQATEGLDGTVQGALPTEGAVEGAAEGGALAEEASQPISAGEEFRKLFATIKSMMTSYLLQILDHNEDKQGCCAGELPQETEVSDCLAELAGAEGAQESEAGEPTDAEALWDSAAALSDEQAAAGHRGRPSILDMPRQRIRMDMTLETFREEETSFSAEGAIHTRDGQVFNIAYDLSMKRSEVESVSTSLMMDPLAIQYDGTAAELSSALMDFDLDADGTTESIPTLANGGWLAWDRNGDGVVNDGHELFGAQSGDGFGELAEYDEDGNGWIDEADSIYDKLSLWSWDAEGNDSLVSARDLGLGAFHLGKADTPFSLIEDGSELGRIRASGLGLREDGNPFAIQQIDLALA